MNFRTSASVSVVAILVSGCIQSAEPLEGYADQNSRVGDGSTFQRQTVQRIVLVNREKLLKDQAIEVSFNDDRTELTIFLNDQTHTLAYDAASPQQFAGYFDEDIYVGTFYNTNPDVQVMNVYFDTELGSDDFGYENLGFVTVGYLTDPRQVASLSGQAEYTGTARAVVSTTYSWDFASGSFRLVADFDSDELSGTIDISDANPGEYFDFPDQVFDFGPEGTPTLAISGNTFSSNLVVADDPEQNIIGGLDGNFYGVDASSIGGTFWLDKESDGVPVLVQGAFAND